MTERIFRDFPRLPILVAFIVFVLVLWGWKEHSPHKIIQRSFPKEAVVFNGKCLSLPSKKSDIASGDQELNLKCTDKDGDHSYTIYRSELIGSDYIADNPQTPVHCKIFHTPPGFAAECDISTSSPNNPANMVRYAVPHQGLLFLFAVLMAGIEPATLAL
jgi:hypothetical protein